MAISVVGPASVTARMYSMFNVNDPSNLDRVAMLRSGVEIVRDHPIADMVEGDVFFHNDVYESEGGIGHLPDLCVTVPVFHDAGDGVKRVVAFVQAFGHHDDIGGACPGSMPSGATSVFEEGLAVPDDGGDQQGGADQFGQHAPPQRNAHQPAARVAGMASWSSRRRMRRSISSRIGLTSSRVCPAGSSTVQSS